MIRRPPRSTLFPTRRSSDLADRHAAAGGSPGRPARSKERLFNRHDAVRRRLGSADADADLRDRKSTRLNSSHMSSSYAVFCLKKKTGHGGTVLARQREKHAT